MSEQTPIDPLEELFAQRYRPSIAALVAEATSWLEAHGELDRVPPLTDLFTEIIEQAECQHQAALDLALLYLGTTLQLVAELRGRVI